MAGAAAVHRAVQVGRARQGEHGQPARAVLLRRQVNGRRGPLHDTALTAVENDVAAPAVLADVEEMQFTPGQVQLRAVFQHHILLRRCREFAAGQQHGGIQRQARAGIQAQRRAQRIRQGRVVGQGRCRTGRRGHHDRAARLDIVDRSRLTREQRRVQTQITAAVSPGLGRLIPGPLRLIDRQRALMVGGDALAGVEVHAGKAQCQTLMRTHGVGLAQRAVAELDGPGIDHKAAAARARAARDDIAGRRGRAVPDQRAGLDAGHVARAAMPVEGRRAQHQALER